MIYPAYLSCPNAAVPPWFVTSRRRNIAVHMNPSPRRTHHVREHWLQIQEEQQSWLAAGVTGGGYPCPITSNSHAPLNNN